MRGSTTSKPAAGWASCERADFSRLQSGACVTDRLRGFNLTKSELIERLVAAGRAADLVLLLEGDSAFTSDETEGAPDDRQLARLWIAAIYHLRFVAEFGDKKEPRCKEGKWLSPFPVEFGIWLDAGAPGIAMTDLEHYVEHHPL